MSETNGSADGGGTGRLRNLLLGLLLAFISLGVGIMGAELVFHLLDLPPDRQGHQQLFVEYDSVFGWRNIPNETNTIIADEYTHELRYNTRSMRGPVIPYEKPAGTLRVLLLGDSFVDGYTEELGDRMSEVLERELGADGLPVEVIPMGTGGYSTDQEYLWFAEEGLRYHPDVVVLVFHPNDVWYNRTNRYWRGYKPHFALESDTLALTGVPVPQPDSARVPAPSVLSRLNGWIRQNSKLYWLVARAAQNNPRAYGLAVRLGLASPSPEMVFDATRGVVTAGEFSVFNATPPPETLEAWQITLALVSRMRDDANAAGADFLAFLIPVRSRIYTQDDDVRAGVAAGNAELNLDAPAQELHDLCVKDGVAYIDPTETFLEAADSLAARNERLYYRYDWHWNANGHRLAGEILARYLRPVLSDSTADPGTGTPMCGG
jgi:lysophospholipase L1-like esterase